VSHIDLEARKAYSKIYRETHKAEITAANKAYYDAHKAEAAAYTEAHKAAKAARARRYRATPEGKANIAACRARRLATPEGKAAAAERAAKARIYRAANKEAIAASTYRRRYNIEPDEYNAMYAAQGGLCAIDDCGRPATVIDHCHVSLKVRGLLCNGCNTASGMLGEDPARTRALADYQERHIAA
jgi:hypothetical protein